MWVCEEHWRASTDPAEDDDFCSSAVLHHEASVLDEHAGLHLASQSGVTRAKRALFKRRKSREASDKDCVSTKEASTSATKQGTKVTSATKKGAALKSSAVPPDDLLIDSNTVLGRSDDDEK